MTKRICKAVDLGLCEGTGWINNDRQNFYCSEKCKENAFNESMQKVKNDNRPVVVHSPSGCTIKPTRKGRCDKSESCLFYSDCLKLVWNFESGGFTSDLKGYKEKKSRKRRWVEKAWRLYWRVYFSCIK
jgi:hypothetical protein